MKITMKIKGMHCEHCRARVEKALSGLENVEKAEVSLTWKKAELETEKDIPDALIKTTITDLGYEITEIKRLKAR